jgi:aryl-alcohol dehydrogenase-like predicted oxidoreductase
LGGHSFITQLGSDSAAGQATQIAIVEACLQDGICWFDTTYQPERIALGKALAALGRRDEATVLAWNFFTDFGADGKVGGPEAYQPYHIELMLEQLQSDHIDVLIVHSVPDEAENRRQEALALDWQSKGYVRALGTWHPGLDAASKYGRTSPYRYMVRPYNVTTRDAAPVFALCKKLGWQTLACSPFVRGWELDRLVEKASARTGVQADTKARVADLMLRYALFQPNVDRLIVAIRRVEWVAANVASYHRGPLTAEERDLLASLYGS